ncbi:hypothetical protein EVAR_45893_1 [Eumeta japonica]|uniref:Uncharacterized protein n=1 Tax=Eumeta variegata TaxID=151549 RepID=A0A4C1XSJ4_EUMVA|nr:hypothetical protein EVAR_45893_1 [Eumeta japonica]
MERGDKAEDVIERSPEPVEPSTALSDGSGCKLNIAPGNRYSSREQRTAPAAEMNRQIWVNIVPKLTASPDRCNNKDRTPETPVDASTRAHVKVNGGHELSDGTSAGGRGLRSRSIISAGGSNEAPRRGDRNTCRAFTILICVKYSLKSAFKPTAEWLRRAAPRTNYVAHPFTGLFESTFDFYDQSVEAVDLIPSNLGPRPWVRRKANRAKVTYEKSCTARLQLASRKPSSRVRGALGSQIAVGVPQDIIGILT